MSILIKGMEMPKRQILAVINPNGLVEVLAGNTLIAEFEAVPVPPHGDLIERDKLRGTMFIGEQCLYSWDEIEDAIDCAPTIIPASEEGE